MELIDQRILKSAQSRIVSMGEFNFDNLAAPPLMSFLDMNDIASLEIIATSIRYSGNPNKKKKAIQEIMVKRGFDKAYLSGTNRIVFKHYDNPNIVMKIAIDDIGRNDNPREFFNQNVLKPFVCKVFEVAGDGVVALTERITPIKTREEFMSIADDVHKLLWILTQKYILADVGEKYYRNYGIRTNMGPVLLDYPYVFEPDEDMLVCSSKDMITGLPCGGLIDYDAGFNELVCTKCGTVYRASEIAKILKDKEIIIKAKEEGIAKMKVSIVRNNRKVTVLDTTNAGVGEIKSSVESITPISNPVNTTPIVPDESVVKVNVTSSINNAREKAIAESPAVKGRVTIRRTPIKTSHNNNNFSSKKNNRDGGNDNKRNYQSRNNDFKVKIARDYKNNGGKPNNTRKEHAPVSKGAVAITAINIEELSNTEFNFSSYDAENGLVFVTGRTPSGSDLKVHFNCKDTTEFIHELGIEEPETVSTTNNADTADLANAVMELEYAKKDLLTIEAENISLKKKIEDMTSELEEKSSAVYELEGRVDGLEASINTNNADAETEKKELLETIESQKLYIEQQNTSIEEKINTISDLQSKIEELDAKIVELSIVEPVQDLSADLAAKDEEIIKLKEELESKNRTIESLNTNLDNRDEAITQLTEELEKAKQLNPKDPDVEPSDLEHLVFINANLYDAAGFLTDEEKKKYKGSKTILGLTITDTDENGKVVEDFCIDDAGRTLAISTINGTSIDDIIFTDSKK